MQSSCGLGLTGEMAQLKAKPVVDDADIREAADVLAADGVVAATLEDVELTISEQVPRSSVAEPSGVSILHCCRYENV